MPDIEPQEVGEFDDTQLAAIDQLMIEAHERGTVIFSSVDSRAGISSMMT
jgi:mannan endo-1,4-beta-mannosidase